MTAERFYLGGGTAIAILLGHRRSVDFDWFTERALGDALALAERVQRAGVALDMEHVGPGTLEGRVSRVRTAFFEYRYPLLADQVRWPEYGCQLASLDDLACMKLSAIAQRGAKKDFIDLYTLATRHRPLPELIAGYTRKYAIANTAHLLYGLTFFEDADRERAPTMLWDLNWRTVKRAIRGWVSELAG
jgi:hypothetical protein